jgi:hypothetical protein
MEILPRWFAGDDPRNRKIGERVTAIYPSQEELVDEAPLDDEEVNLIDDGQNEDAANDAGSKEVP